MVGSGDGMEQKVNLTLSLIADPVDKQQKCQKAYWAQKLHSSIQ
jgi:hypothetical protein